MSKAQKKPKLPKLEDLPEEEEEKKEEPQASGKFTRLLFETTYCMTILIFGTLVGTLFALVLPLGFPLMILWRRYTQA